MAAKATTCVRFTITIWARRQETGDTPELLFGYMGVQLDAKKAEGKTLAINWILPDINEKHSLFLENSVLIDLASILNGTQRRFSQYTN
jgi:alkyl sulfatase BDS1-like metallo-beta-lactamase superfamily hydrolase